MADSIKLNFLAKNMNKGRGVCGHNFIDLLLPSGTLWATCNIGAKKPEDYGEYFMWNCVARDEHIDFDMTIDAKTGDIFPEYDIASRSWGAMWRTPTIWQLRELAKNTRGINIMSEDGSIVKKVISKKDESRFIILPLNGSYYFGYGENVGDDAFIWSRTSLNDDAPDNTNHEYAILGRWCGNREGMEAGGGWYSERKAGIRPVIYSD